MNQEITYLITEVYLKCLNQQDTILALKIKSENCKEYIFFCLLFDHQIRQSHSLDCWS